MLKIDLYIYYKIKKEDLNMEKDIYQELAEKDWEDFKKSSFGKFFTAKQLKDQELTYLNNKALDIVNEEDLFEIMKNKKDYDFFSKSYYFNN